MKRLMFMISTHGKTPQQIEEEVLVATQKYQQAEKKALETLAKNEEGDNE